MGTHRPSHRYLRLFLVLSAHSVFRSELGKRQAYVLRFNCLQLSLDYQRRMGTSRAELGHRELAALASFYSSSTMLNVAIRPLGWWKPKRLSHSRRPDR